MAAKPKYIESQNKNIIFEGFVAKRIQTLDNSSTFNEETIQEMSNKGNVAVVATEKTYELSVNAFDYGHIDFIMHIANKDTSAENTGTFDLDDLDNVIVNPIIQVRNEDDELIQAKALYNCRIDSFTFTYAVDGNATEDFSFVADKQLNFLNNNKNIRNVRGERTADTTISVPIYAGDDQTLTGENIGTGDGSETVFNTTYKPIVAASYTVYVGGVSQTESIDYTIDTDTGTVTFESGSIPGIGLDVTIDYDFDGTAGHSLYIEDEEVDSANWSILGNEITLSGGVTVDAGDRIVYYYVPNYVSFEELTTDYSEQAVLRRGNIDIFLYNSGDSEAKQLRLQNVTINGTFSRTALYQIGQEESYANHSSERNIEVSLELNESDLEVLAKSVGKYSEYVAGTLTEIDFNDIVRTLILEVNVYNSVTIKDATTKLRNIKIENLTLTSPSDSMSVGGIGTESFTLSADNITVEGFGNL